MIFLAILLTAFVYLIFPILYVANKGKVSPKKGRKLALSNVIICAVIFFIITLIIVSSTENANAEIGGKIGGYSLAPAFFYYFIAKAILTDKKLKDEETAKKPTENNNEFTTNPNADEDLFNDETQEEKADQIDARSFPPNSLKQLPPELLALLGYATHISLQDDAPTEDYVNKVRQKTIKDAQPEIDELYFKTFSQLQGKEISDNIVDRFTEEYADIIVKHYKKNIFTYLKNNKPKMENISLEDSEEMFDFMLSILKEQILESKPTIEQQLLSYKKVLDDFYKN